MEMAVRSMETAEAAMETDGDGSGGTYPSRQGAGTETFVPRNSSARRRSCGTLSENLPILPGFSIGRLLIGEGASSEVDQGGLTHRGRGPGAGRAALLCGRPMALLSPLFGLLEASLNNRRFGFCFVQFREYFLCNFSETQKQQKTGN
jgi:hypothetical protein